MCLICIFTAITYDWITKVKKYSDDDIAGYMKNVPLYISKKISDLNRLPRKNGKRKRKSTNEQSNKKSKDFLEDDNTDGDETNEGNKKNDVTFL